MRVRFGVAAFLAAPLLTGSGPPAAAGAWTQQPGAGQVIASASSKSAQFSPFSGGRIADDSNFVSLFFEYGVVEGITAGGTVFVEIATDGAGGNTLDLGAFVRARVWQSGHGDVAAVQLGVKQDANGLLGDEFGGPDADPTNEVSLRALYGRGFGFDWGSAFVSTEAGYHLQTDGDVDELRADVTGGVQPWECCMILLSAFSTVPLGDEEASVKLAPSVTYSFRGAAEAADEGAPPPKPVTLQLGLSQDLLDFGDGLGVQISVWRPF